MKHGILFQILLIGWALAVSSCEKSVDIPEASRSVRFQLSLDAQTKTPQRLDLESYTAKLYTFKETSTDEFVFADEQEIVSPTITVSELDRNTRYKFVFLAIPKSQHPALLNLVGGLYTDALMQYLEGNQPGQEVFRNILTLSSSDAIDSYSIVLTRQNGAIQIRMSHADGTIKSVKLEVEGMPEMIFHDGTGGKVLTQGTAVTLSKSEQPPVTDDYRISINLLPTEDLTNRGTLTLSLMDGTEQVYSLKSTLGTIPIYPNQVTWLLLKGSGDSSSFEAGFGGHIDLDDDQWDGV